MFDTAVDDDMQVVSSKIDAFIVLIVKCMNNEHPLREMKREFCNLLVSQDEGKNQ